MRDVIVTLILLAVMPTCFKKPFVGLLIFSLLAYMRVQDLTWGFARTIRWSFYIAIITFSGFFVSHRERRFMVNDLRTVIMIILVAMVGLSILKNRGPDPGDLPGFLEFTKIVVIALFTTGMVGTRERLRMLLWVIALSFAFFGFKSGIVGVLTLGSTQILQGPGGMLQDNNDFALALAMGIPMMVMLGRSERRDVLRKALLTCVPLTMITIALTHSRGGFLAMVVGITVLIARSRNKVAGFAMMGLIGLGGVLMAPQGIVERLQSISEYEEDASAQARLAAWRTAGMMIRANPVFGVGFGHFEDNYVRYDPARQDADLELHGSHVAHNSYLQIWAECGTPTLLLYLMLIAISYLDLWAVRGMARRRFHSSWILNYATMFEASLTTFMLGSVFLNRAHFDLFYHWVAIILAFTTIARRHMDDPTYYPQIETGRGLLYPVTAKGFDRPLARDGFRRRAPAGGAL
jgi:putative inorganic carbon (HCO3(-)) transporter